MATIGTILIQASNQAANLGVGSGQGSMSDSSSAAKDKREQVAAHKNIAEQTDQGKQAPKFWTAAFKKMGIQMGLSGLLKQSQIFTSTVGSLFQILGAFVDVILAPFVPIMIPAMRWLARQLPFVAKGMKVVADKIFKVVGSVWDWLFKGGIKKTIFAIWEWMKGTTGFGGIIEFFKHPGQSIADAFGSLKGILIGWAHDIYDATIAKIKITNPFTGETWFEMPKWARGGADTGTAARSVAPLGDEDLLPPNWKPTPTSKDTPKDTPSSIVDFAANAAREAATKAVKQGINEARNLSFMEGLGVTASILAGGKGINVLTQSVTTAGIQKRIWQNMPDMLSNNQELNMLRRLPLTGVTHSLTQVPAKAFDLAVGGAAKGSMNVMRNMPDLVNDFARGKFFGGLTDTQSAKIPWRRSTPSSGGGPGPGAASDYDTKAARRTPTQISNAVQKFNKWLRETGSRLQGAAGRGKDAFKTVYDEGFRLADDVVKLASRTAGFQAVGKIVSVGFKRVIPGLAGAYMIGETIQDVWKIVKSDAPWLGDWKSLDAYKAEAMGALFAGNASVFGGATNILGWAQKKLGLGSNISDWQDQIAKNQQEKGVLSSGKLMDAIIRGATGAGGAALSTFFPGLGTLAGTALYEGGRYATTGINVPGLGQIGGDIDKYGLAVDFSDKIIQAIETGWSHGVGNIDGQP